LNADALHIQQYRCQVLVDRNAFAPLFLNASNAPPASAGNRCGDQPAFLAHPESAAGSQRQLGRMPSAVLDVSKPRMAVSRLINAVIRPLPALRRQHECETRRQGKMF
jgi:hypothetical protein